MFDILIFPPQIFDFLILFLPLLNAVLDILIFFFATNNSVFHILIFPPQIFDLFDIFLATSKYCA